MIQGRCRIWILLISKSGANGGDMEVVVVLETVAAELVEVINCALFLLLRPAEIVPKDGPGVKPRLAPPPVVIPRQLSHLIDQSNCHAVIVHHQIDPLTGLRGICHCPMPINHTCCNFETDMQNLFVKPNGSDPLPLSSASALATRFYRAAKKKRIPKPMAMPMCQLNW